MPHFKHTNKNSSKVVCLHKNTCVFVFKTKRSSAKETAYMFHFGSIIRQITECCKNKTVATVPLRLILDFFNTSAQLFTFLWSNDWLVVSLFSKNKFFCFTMGEEGKQRLFLCSDGGGGGGGGAGPNHWPTLLYNVLMLQWGKMCAIVSVYLPFFAALLQQVTSE